MIAAAALAALFAADTAAYQLAVRSETRSGSTDATVVPSPSLDEQIGLFAGVSGTSGRLRIDADYAPTLHYDFRAQRDADLLHTGNAVETYKLARGTTVTFGQTASYGHRDFSPLAPQAIDPTRTLPAVQDPRLAALGVVSYLQWGASVGLAHALAPGVVLGLDGSYGSSGGADASARDLLPLQHTAHASARLGWTLDRRDAIGFTAAFLRSSSDAASASSMLAAALGLTHRFSSKTEGSLGAGASVSRDETAGAATQTPVNPTAAAGLTHVETVFGKNVVSAARVALDTALDPFGAGTYSRVEGSLSLGIVPLRSLSFQLRGSGARAITSRPQLQNSLWQLEATSSYSFVRGMDASVGCRTAWADAASAAAGMQWSAFASLGFAYGERL